MNMMHKKGSTPGVLNKTPFFMQQYKHRCIQLNADIFIYGDSMPDNYNMFDRLGGSIQKKKLEKALEMFHNESPQELRRKVGNIDTSEILEKLEEYNPQKLRQMGINIDELKGKITEKDFEKLIQVLGPDGRVVVQKLRSLLK